MSKCPKFILEPHLRLFPSLLRGGDSRKVWVTHKGKCNGIMARNLALSEYESFTVIERGCFISRLDDQGWYEFKLEGLLQFVQIFASRAEYVSSSPEFQRMIEIERADPMPKEWLNSSWDKGFCLVF